MNAAFEFNESVGNRIGALRKANGHVNFNAHIRMFFESDRA